MRRFSWLTVAFALCTSSSWARGNEHDRPWDERPGIENDQPSQAVPRGDPSAPSTWQERPFAIEADVGIATPLGGVGLMADYSVAPWLSASCGAGTNITGLQLACMVRPRWVLHERQAFYLGLGGSMGPYVQGGNQAGIMAPANSLGEQPYPGSFQWSRAYWANFEFGYEERGRGGFFVRPFGGLAVLLNEHDPIERRPEDSSKVVRLEVVHLLAYFGIGFGYAF